MYVKFENCLCINFFKVLLTKFEAFFLGVSSERLCLRLRSMLFRNVMSMHMGYFDMPKHSSGKISTRLATDTPNVKTVPLSKINKTLDFFPYHTHHKKNFQKTLMFRTRNKFCSEFRRSTSVLEIFFRLPVQSYVV